MARDGRSRQEERETSDFLKYKDPQGHFADFYALRHTFVTNLFRAGVSPKIAQLLARRSDIRLTMERYTQIEQAEQVGAIKALGGLAK